MYILMTSYRNIKGKLGNRLNVYLYKDYFKKIKVFKAKEANIR